MKINSNLLLAMHFIAFRYLINCSLKNSRKIFIASLLLTGLGVKGQTNNYFGSSGNVGTNAWSANPAGPYTSPLNSSGGAIINFGNAATVTGATIDIKAISATANVSLWIGGGTLGTGGNIAAINVANGITLNMFSQTISTSAGTGLTKTGAGTLALSNGSNYQGGFTLTDGAIIVGGVNALGGNILNLDGGIIASNADRDLSGKYPGGINIGGNVQFGDVTGLASSTAGITFSNNISLGALTRTLISGNAGTTTFSGIISGANGICFTKNINGTGIFDITHPANTFSGPVNINDGITRFAADGSFGNASNSIVIDGGKMLTNTTFSIQHQLKLGNTVGTGIIVASGTLTIDAPISDKTTLGSFTKYGAGTLVLTNANDYTGTTFLDLSGGTLQLNRPGGNTIPNTNNVVVNGGVFKISSNQTLNNLSLVNGNLTIDNGATLTINGVFDYFQTGTITITGTGKIAYGPAGTVKYSGTIATSATAIEFPATMGPNNVNSNNAGGVTLPFSRIITGSLVLGNGIFTIGAGVLLDLDGASLVSGGGFLAGNSILGSTANLTISGTTGGTVILPANANIGLNNLTIGGTRTVALNGTNNLVLSGTLTIAAAAVFDNGGESQVTNGGSPAINISGTFITRDLEGFCGTNTSIPVINPILNAGCTVEYGRAGNQGISIRSDYQNLRFTGGGIKTHAVANSISPISGTVTITDLTTLDVSNNTFGSAATNFTMMNGRFRVSGTGTKPDMDGGYNLSGNSVVEFYNSGTAINETIRGKNGVGADILYNQIEVTGNKVGNSNSNITLNANGVFMVKSGGVFEINDNSIIAAPSTGGQSVVVENNATFLCGNNKGFNGFTPTVSENSSIHANITNITLATGTPGSTVNYTRAGDQPVTIANGLSYSNLIFSGSGIKTAPSATLAINGNLSKPTACLFDPNNGQLLFNNSAATQTISALVSPTFTFYDLMNSNTSAAGLKIANSISIIHVLALSTNCKLDITNADIILLSTATNTASVAPVPGSAAILYSGTGRFVVQRYFPAARSWRLLTSPLSSHNTPTTIFSQWQNNGIYTPGIGTFISGPNPDNAINGLDDSYYDNYSLATFQNNAYVNVGNTLTPLSNSSPDAANIGYLMFVRGDRSRSPDNTVFPNKNNTTLSSRGKLQVGLQNFPGYTRTIAGPRNFALIGNPYASPVNFNSLSRVNLLKRFIVWDPKINQVGAFVYIDDPDNDGIYTVDPVSPGGQDLNIQSSQAFFVETGVSIGASGITFTEGSKSTVNNPGMFRPVPVTASFRSSLYLVNADNSTLLADGNLAEFNADFNDTVDIQDAVKFTNVNETFCLLRNNTSIAVERRPTIVSNDTLFFNITRITQRKYQLRFEPNMLDPLLSAFLEDSFTGINTPISNSSPGTYNFSVNEQAPSAAANRFRVVFRLEKGGALPVTFNNVKAGKQGNNIAIEWSVENELNINKYEIEKSADGADFSYEHTIFAKGNINNKIIYTWLDTHPAPGNNYYRIKSVDFDGKMEYSRIVKVLVEKETPGISIFPNPVNRGKICLQFNNCMEGRYEVSLLNLTGQIVLRKSINHTTGNPLTHIVPDYKLAPGIYQLRIIAPNKEIILVKAVVQ